MTWTCARKGPKECSSPAPEWSEGYCRICDRDDAPLTGELGIPAGVILDATRTCPECGSTWPEAQVCHICGGPGERGDFWDALGLRSPEVSTRFGAPWVRIAASLVDVDESGRLNRRDFRRFCRELGANRWMSEIWKALIDDWNHAVRVGDRLAEWKQLQPKKSKADK